MPSSSNSTSLSSPTRRTHSRASVERKHENTSPSSKTTLNHNTSDSILPNVSTTVNHASSSVDILPEIDAFLDSNASPLTADNSNKDTEHLIITDFDVDDDDEDDVKGKSKKSRSSMGTNGNVKRSSMSTPSSPGHHRRPRSASPTTPTGTNERPRIQHHHQHHPPRRRNYTASSFTEYITDTIHDYYATFKDYLRNRHNISDEMRKTIYKVLLYILGWYTLALGLSVYNKWLFGKETFAFPFPLFCTMVHMMIQFCCSFTVLTFISPQYRPTRRPSLHDYLTKVFPCGIASGMDIGLSNSSLKFITLSFYTMVKSAAPVFVLLFSFLFKLEKRTWSLTLVIFVICFGVILTVVDELRGANFHWVGFTQAFIATVLSGLRWSLTQILLERESMGMNNPFATILFLAPLMATTLFVATQLLEGFGTILASDHFSTSSKLFETFGITIVGGFMSFFMVVLEYRVIAITSVVAFSVAGIVKEIVTILVSHIIFKDEFTFWKIMGLCISIMGIAWFNYMRIRRVPSKYTRFDRGNSNGSLGIQEGDGVESGDDVESDVVFDAGDLQDYESGSDAENGNSSSKEKTKKKSSKKKRGGMKEMDMVHNEPVNRSALQRVRRLRSRPNSLDARGAVTRVADIMGYTSLNPATSFVVFSDEDELTDEGEDWHMEGVDLSEISHK